MTSQDTAINDENLIIKLPKMIFRDYSGNSTRKFNQFQLKNRAYK